MVHQLQRLCNLFAKWLCERILHKENWVCRTRIQARPDIDAPNLRPKTIIKVFDVSACVAQNALYVDFVCSTGLTSGIHGDGLRLASNITVAEIRKAT